MLLEGCVRRAEVGLAGFWCALVKSRLMSFIAPFFPQAYEFPEHDSLDCRCKCKVA